LGIEMVAGFSSPFYRENVYVEWGGTPRGKNTKSEYTKNCEKTPNGNKLSIKTFAKASTSTASE